MVPLSSALSSDEILDAQVRGDSVSRQFGVTIDDVRDILDRSLRTINYKRRLHTLALELARLDDMQKAAAARNPRLYGGPRVSNSPRGASIGGRDDSAIGPAATGFLE
jgi:hypothetical protein